MPQAQKFNGLRSGDFGGHCAVEMKRGTTFLSHSWLTRADCGGAKSCWNVHDLRLKCLSAQVDEYERVAIFGRYGDTHHYHRRRMSSGNQSHV